MKHTTRLIAWIALCVVLINLNFVFAEDWPQWRGMNRDGKVAGFKAPATWPAEMTQKWKVVVGTGDATPALADGKLYVFTRIDADEVIQCLDAASGNKLWEDKYGAITVSGGAGSGSHRGPRSSPAVSDGKVVTLGIGGVLSCLDKDTGKVLWRKEEFTAVPKFYTGTSPIVVDKMCIVHLGGSDQGHIIAFDLETGKEKWRWDGDGPDYSSPVLMTVENTKQVVFQASKSIVGIAVDDGRLLWQATNVATQSFNAATPVVDGQTVIYTRKNMGTKALKVQKEGDGFSVKELWSNPEIACEYSTPVLKDGMLFGFSERSKLFCMNADTGEIAWVNETEYKNFGSILDAGSVMIVLTSDPEFVVFKPDGKQYEQVAKIKVADSPVYAHPVISGNAIYIEDENTLTMFTVG
jgi:outer membrane protein assembly factor BamB